MLQQIFNITPSSDLDKSKKFQRYRKIKKERFNSGGKAHDTACLSAASQFLSKVNWQINNLSFEETDEFILNFSTGEYIFNVKFNIHNFISQDGIGLEVIRQLNDLKRMVITNLVPFDVLSPDTSEVNNDFESLSILFTRLKYLAEENEIKTISEGIYEDLSERLSDELGNLCSMVVTFAEKLLSIDLWDLLKGAINLNFNDKIIVRNVKIR